MFPYELFWKVKNILSIVKKCTYQKTAKNAPKRLQCSFQTVKYNLLLSLFLLVRKCDFECTISLLFILDLYPRCQSLMNETNHNYR